MFIPCKKLKFLSAQHEAPAEKRLCYPVAFPIVFLLVIHANYQVFSFTKLT